jgi:hypothetical protein
LVPRNPSISKLLVEKIVENEGENTDEYNIFVDMLKDELEDVDNMINTKKTKKVKKVKLIIKKKNKSNGQLDEQPGEEKRIVKRTQLTKIDRRILNETYVTNRWRKSQKDFSIDNVDSLRKPLNLIKSKILPMLNDKKKFKLWDKKLNLFISKIDNLQLC